MLDQPHFDLEQHDDGDKVTVRLRGELDLASASTLAEVLRGHLDARRKQIIDLSAVTFMDNAGVRVITDALLSNGLASHSLLRIRPPEHRQPLRLLELTGLLGLLGATSANGARSTPDASIPDDAISILRNLPDRGDSLV